ncbi:hypothetical protein AALP_AA4G205100 [Arabis alpina]|uniref:DUF1664 domain-containing protein n=1 Tax=Arabis alpina TaxID=50452 RepID=A0A087H4J0_ARAAL|nr:hypothetical protein AALP_AA4G205100 [Arabis alpina]
MAMQSGIGLSRIVLLAGAGYTGTIMMQNGKLSDLLGELLSLVKGLEKSEDVSEGGDSDALIASQVRLLSMEVRQLASSRQITVMDGVGVSNANLQALALPAAALGAIGYGYMRWKGISFSDLMYVTKANMAKAVANLTKNLEQVSETLAGVKRHLMQKIQSVDDKVEMQNELTKETNYQVTLVREDMNSIEMQMESLKNFIAELDGQIDMVQDKQDVTNVYMLNLYNYFGGKTTKLPEIGQLQLPVKQRKGQLQLPVNQRARNLLPDVESKGLKNFAEVLFEGNDAEGTTTVKQIGSRKVIENSRPLLSRASLTIC